MTIQPPRTPIHPPRPPGQPLPGTMTVKLPEDVKPAWLNVFRRLQSIASKRNGGIAVLTIRVVVDENGTPIFWTEPSCTLLEPKGQSHDILRLLTGAIGEE